MKCEMKKVWKCIKPNLQRTKFSGRVDPKIKVAQNDLKHIYEFMKSKKIALSGNKHQVLNQLY